MVVEEIEPAVAGSDTAEIITKDYGQFQIMIGCRDIIGYHLSPILAEDQSDPEIIKKADRKLQELLKEMRVRVGTLLKTDNVSFLLGAGASIKAGGVSLANIPNIFEAVLIRTAENEQENATPPGWISLFYATASSITQTELTYENRHSLIHINDGVSLPVIPINIEAYLSYLHMWLAGMSNISYSTTLCLNDGSRLELKQCDLERLIKEITKSLSLLLDLPSTKSGDGLLSHQRFIKKILTRPLNLRRANLFTLNYDTLLEQAADAEGAVLVDGFVGTLRRVFRPESYDLDFYFPAQTTEGRVHRFDRALHLYKLHGSLTWHRCEQGWENPYGLYASFFEQNCGDDDVLIYPSPLKYGQALGLPYSELFRRLGNAIAQPQSVLFTIGYGFGDDHVNAQIRQALSIPSFTLIVVDPNPSNEFVKKLEALKDERVWIVKGWELGTFEAFVQQLLPDLREEEIDAKVMNTYKSLAKEDGGNGK